MILPIPVGDFLTYCIIFFFFCSIHVFSILFWEIDMAICKSKLAIFHSCCVFSAILEIFWNKYSVLHPLKIWVATEYISVVGPREGQFWIPPGDIFARSVSHCVSGRGEVPSNLILACRTFWKKSPRMLRSEHRSKHESHDLSSSFQNKNNGLFKVEPTPCANPSWQATHFLPQALKLISVSH